MINADMVSEIMFFVGVLVGMIIGMMWGFKSAYNKFHSILTHAFNDVRAMAKKCEN